MRPSNRPPQDRTRPHESEEGFRALFQDAPVSIALCDGEGIVIEINRAARELFGLRSDADARGFSIFSGMEMPAGPLARARAGETARFEVQFDFDRARERGVYRATRNGCVHLDVTMRPFDAPPRGFIVIALDITARAHMERRLRDHEAQLEALAEEITRADERERRRMAEDLHDQLAQNLALAKLRLQTLRAAAQAPDARRPLDEVIMLLDQSIGQTRSMAFQLSPPTLFHLGFIAGMEWLVGQYRDRYGLECRFEHDGQLVAPPEDLRALLFRAVRELLNNVVKHARARSARVTLSTVGNEVHLAVSDDGIGFAPRDDGAPAHAGFGWLSLRERLARAGGRIAVASRPGAGARVSLVVPSPAPGASDVRKDEPSCRSAS